MCTITYTCTCVVLEEILSDSAIQFNLYLNIAVGLACQTHKLLPGCNIPLARAILRLEHRTHSPEVTLVL